MSFHRVEETVKIPRNEAVDIHVRRVMLNSEDTEDRQVPCIEIREFLKEAAVYGHGLVIPLAMRNDVKVALDRVGGK